MTSADILAAVINNKHGWAVTDQFVATFVHNKPLEEQNLNALDYIHKTLREVMLSDVLNLDANDELEDYIVWVSNYLEEAKKYI